MTTRQISADDWDKMEDANMVITDVGIVSKKEKAPSQDYFVIENTIDGKKANFPEGLMGLTTRYICYTKKTASPQRGFVVVTELKVYPLNDRAPLGFLPLLYTMDDNSKSFHSKQLLVRIVALEEATEAITDIIILSAQRKEDVPAKYKRLPEINGFSICYKMGPVPKKKSGKDAKQQPPSSVSTPPTNTEGGGFPIKKDRMGSSTKQIRKAIDGITFELTRGKEDLVSQYRLNENFKTMSLQDIENQYNFDFSKWNSLVT